MFPSLTAPDMLAATGLLLDIVGILLRFWFDPAKHLPLPQVRAFFKAADEVTDLYLYNKVRKIRAGLDTLGISLIVVGFFLQILALVAW